MNTPDNLPALAWLLAAAASVGLGWVVGCALGHFVARRLFPAKK